MTSIQSYLTKIQSSLASGHATEHTYRPELRDLFSELTEFHIINEPKGSEHGKPDFIFLKGEGKDAFPIAYGEAKDMHIGLEKIEKSEQLSRYFGYAKLILTNGIEFRFYRNGIRYGEPITLATKKDSTLTFQTENFGIFRDRLMDFLASPVDTIRRANHLAEIMGGKARRIRDNLREMMGNTDRYPDIWKLYNTFKSEILHDLSYEDFADLYAQTLVYGLFVARYHDKTPDTFSRSEARDLVPKSNPLLRRFFDHIAGEGYEKRLEYIVDELCGVFAHADVHALMHGLYQKETHDPVIHFYEDFLGEYDDSLRKLRGVFYTPAPVVKFIIRAVDDVLKTHFNLQKGLADTSKIKVEKGVGMIETDKRKADFGKEKTTMIETHRVQILDPATGTGTFLDEIVRHIHSKMQGQAGMWPSYVNQDLLPRLHGFELMMASYTIAHLKLGLTLAETGVTDLEKRLQIYLTNSLEEAKGSKENQGNIFGLLESITDEARLADEVKRDKPVMIVVGNPPYSVKSKNKNEYILNLIADYKKGLNEKKINLDDDYIKFIRLGESLIEKNGEGILAYISNNSFISGITHRQMRKHLMETFDEIIILDLHGWKEEGILNGKIDENVFDIMQGVCISIYIKKNTGKNKELAKVSHIDLVGKRQEKYDWLEDNNTQTALQILPVEPYYFFVPKNFEGKEKYDEGFGINELMLINSNGIESQKDLVNIFYQDKDRESFFNLCQSINADSLRLKYNLEDGRDWKVETALNDINSSKILIKKIQFRPFDYRFTNFTGKTKGIMAYPRYDIMKNFISGDTLGLLVCRKTTQDFRHVFITKNIVDGNITASAKLLGTASVFPLYLYSDGNTLDGVAKIPNLDPEIWKQIDEIVGETTPEQILDYIYAVLHSPSYREKYKEFLKIDFPRVPYPTSRKQFDLLVSLGGELRTLHLLENPKVEEYITTFPVAGTNEVEKIVARHCEARSNPETPGSPRSARDDRASDIYINSTQYFGDVPEIAWNFYIGGYQPAQKWLKDRKGRTLTWEDIAHYQSMIVALTETSRVMGEVDRVLEV